MKLIDLAGTGRSTSQLGFGCSSLMSATGRKESLALLEHAWAAGIRHFDVAPMYGYGAAESCLGEFLSRHTGEATVTTKFGISPPSNQGFVQAARAAARPLLHLLPGIKKRLAGAARNVTQAAAEKKFNVNEARPALERSLSLLRVECLDLWLLHEVEASDLHEDSLLQFLQDSVHSGKIRSFGAGSSADKVPALVAHKPAYCPVLQFEWSILDKPFELLNVFTLHHRTLTANFAQLRSALEDDLQTRTRWSLAIDADLSQPGMLAALMLKAALVLNPKSLILVSSKNPAHIRENVRVSEDGALAEPARKLYEVAQKEAASLLGRN